MASPDPNARFFATDHLRKDLKGRSVRGGAVTASTQALQFIVRFGSTAILARLLTPEDYGLIGMTAVVTGFVMLFRDAGLTSAVIQRDELNHRQVSTLFWINVALGCGLAGVLALLAPLVATFYDEPRLTQVTLALAATFVLGGFTVQHGALLRRQMRFKTLAVISLLSMLAGVVTAIALAWLGFRYWSLVGMNVVTALVHLMAVWIAHPWRPGPPVRGSGVGALVRFGSDILGFNIVNYLARKADNLLIGWCWGAGALGLYDKAYTLLLFPISQINHPLGAVATPALARSRSNPAELRRYFLTLHHLVACAGVPIVFGIALFAPEIVQLWLGPRWSEAAGLFRLLAAAALVGAMANPTGWLLVSLGLTRRYRNMGLLSSTLIVLSFGLGLGYGAQGVAAAYSCAMVLMIIPLWYFVLPGTGIRLRDMLANLVTPLVSGVAAVAAGWGMQVWLNPLLPGLVAFALAGVAFAATYAGLLLGVFGERDLVGKILQAFRRKPASPTAAPPPPQGPPQTQ